MKKMKEIFHYPPVLASHYLQVKDMDRYGIRFSYHKGLHYRLENMGPFVTHMGQIQSTKFSQSITDFPYLFRIRVHSRWIDKPACHAESPLLHRLGYQAFHVGKLFLIGTSVLKAKNIKPYRPVSQQRRKR